MAFTPTGAAARSSSLDRFIKFVEISGLFSQVFPLSCDNSPPKKGPLSHLSTFLGGSEDVDARDALACERRGSQALQLSLSDKLKRNQTRNHLSAGQYAATFIRALRSLKSALYWRSGTEIRGQSLRNCAFCELETVKHQLCLFSDWSSTGEALHTNI